MKRGIRLDSRTILAIICCWAICIVFPLFVEARSPEPLEGVKFDVSISMADNLKAFIGKDVSLSLRSGKTVQGYVKAIGNGLVHLEKLAGRDFYDALIRIEDITAIEARFRSFK